MITPRPFFSRTRAAAWQHNRARRRLMLSDPGTIHRDIHAAKFPDGRIHHGEDVLGNSDIRLQGKGPPSRFTYFFGRALRIFDVEIASGYIAAKFREAKRKRFAKAHSSAGDECHVPAKIK